MSEPQPEEKQEEKQPETQSSFEAERQASNKLIQGLQTFIQLMLSGGSGGVFLSFLFQQDWFMALLTFPFMCGAIVWTAISKGVFTGLSKSYEQRATEKTVSFVNNLDNFDKAFRQLICKPFRLNQTERKYLENQKVLFDDYLTEGFQGKDYPCHISIEDVFVPLRLVKSFSLDYGKNTTPTDIEEEYQRSIWSILENAKQASQYRCWAIIAKGGHGKTTLLRHVIFTYAAKKQKRYKAPKVIPVLLFLRTEQKKLSVENKPSLIELLDKHISDKLDGTQLPSNWVKNMLDKGKMLVMFDGFDEIKDSWRESISYWLGDEMKKYPHSYFILTSRPEGFNIYNSDKALNRLSVLDFNEEQRNKFITRWYLTLEKSDKPNAKLSDLEKKADMRTKNLIEQLDKRPELKELTKNPLLLNMVATVHSSYQFDYANPSESIPLPYNRAGLYKWILELELGDRPYKKGKEMSFPFKESQQILQKLAFDLALDQRTTVEKEELLSKLQEYINDIDDSVKASRFLTDMENVSELLVLADEYYEFSHKTFQEYLVAVEIESEKLEDRLL